jgi:hypothetical protein
MDRNALIVRNRVEALERRRADLQRQISVVERQNAELSAKYNERLVAARIQAVFEGRPAAKGKDAKLLQVLQREAYRQTFVVGFAVSLILGLISAFH